MYIAITSDIHNNLANLKKVLNYCANKKITTMVCCGDLASIETLDFLNANFLGKIYYCFGNMDNEQMNQMFSSLPKNNSDEVPSEKYKQTLVFKDYGEAEIDHKKIAFVHFPEKAKQLCESKKYDFVFYGHTHKPWEETIKNCKMLNPGNIANEIYPPTFAIWNTENDKFKLVRVNELE